MIEVSSSKYPMIPGLVDVLDQGLFYLIQRLGIIRYVAFEAMLPLHVVSKNS